ncbi:MAG: MarR family transcriptional regulator [Kofleriaceae bacterium]
MATRRGSVAFLLAQVGALAAERFGERAATIGLTRAQTGTLRILARGEPMSQQALAEALDLVPSRLVVIVDELAEMGVVERRAAENDRRAHALHLTPKGKELMGKLSQVGQEHDQTFTAPLTDAEKTELGALLEKLATAHGLTPQVHPGYRTMGPPEKKKR